LGDLVDEAHFTSILAHHYHKALKLSMFFFILVLNIIYA